MFLSNAFDILPFWTEWNLYWAYFVYEIPSLFHIFIWAFPSWITVSFHSKSYYSIEKLVKKLASIILSGTYRPYASPEYCCFYLNFFCVIKKEGEALFAPIMHFILSLKCLIQLSGSSSFHFVSLSFKYTRNTNSASPCFFF